MENEEDRGSGYFQSDANLQTQLEIHFNLVRIAKNFVLGQITFFCDRQFNAVVSL